MDEYEVRREHLPGDLALINEPYKSQYSSRPGSKKVYTDPNDRTPVIVFEPGCELLVFIIGNRTVRKKSWSMILTIPNEDSGPAMGWVPSGWLDKA